MDAQKDLTSELEQTQDQLLALTEKVERNTAILQQSQQRELRLLRAQDIAALLAEMTVGLKTSYQLEVVSVVLADPDHDVRHLLIAGGTRPREIRGLIMVEALTGLAPQYIGLPRPWLGLFSASDHQLVFDGCQDISSIAIIPLMHRGALFGSINFGSADSGRFTKHHATDFLAHLGIIASFALENAINRARLLRSGFTDVLTGWNNRRYLQVRLTEELARASRDGKAITCLMIDIDHFKQINDQYGHAAGDEALREIAQRIEAQVRVSDVAARYGGEEFVVLLPATTAAAGVILAQRIRRAVADASFDLGNGRRRRITTSVGVASASPGKYDKELKSLGESLLARADVALYQAKSSGRNRVELEQTSDSHSGS